MKYSIFAVLVFALMGGADVQAAAVKTTANAKKPGDEFFMPSSQCAKKLNEKDIQNLIVNKAISSIKLSSMPNPDFLTLEQKLRNAMKNETCTLKELVTQLDKAINVKQLIPSRAENRFYESLNICGKPPINSDNQYVVDCNKKIKDIASDVAFLGKMVAWGKCTAFDEAGFKKSLEKETCTVKEFVTQIDKARDTKKLMCPKAQIRLFNYFKACGSPTWELAASDCHKKIKDIASDIATIGVISTDGPQCTFYDEHFIKSLEKETCTVTELVTQPDKAKNSNRYICELARNNFYNRLKACGTPPAYDVKAFNEITADMGAV